MNPVSRKLVTFCGFLLLVGAAETAIGEVAQIKIGRSNSVGYLPIMVMEDLKLLEKHAKAAGLSDVAVQYIALGGGAALNDALLSDSLQIASGGVPPFLLLWSKTQNNLQVKALSALNSMEVYLNTRNPDVRSIKDFTQKDRIAVLSAKSSLQAMLLQMEAAKVFGANNYAQLDPLTVSMPLADAAMQLISGSGGQITSDFTVPPFSYQELAVPGVRAVLTSREIVGGPSTYTLAYTTTRFQSANPKLSAAFIAALDEEIRFINQDRKAAGDVFVRVSKSTAPREMIDRMLSDPAITFERTPQNLMRFADFMHMRGTIQAKPMSWKDFFFPSEIHNLPGS